MPAAAVIPAPIAYAKVVAVKKLVVGFFVVHFEGRPFQRVTPVGGAQWTISSFGKLLAVHSFGQL